MTTTTQSPDATIRTAIAIGRTPHSSRVQLVQQLVDGAPWERLERLVSSTALGDAERVLHRCRELSVQIVPYTSDRYPPLLRASSSPPAAVYIKASSPNLSLPTKMVAVVGTRSATVEMCQRTSLLSLHLAQSGLPVVSGLALGVDGAAHRGALTATTPCPTIAVVAHGLDRIYPASHSHLAESILLKGGALVSEYPPGTEPLKHHFLERNRIIAALALGVVVVQAGERSGSLVTARFAADFGRDVFVMETSDEDSSFRGGAHLIEEGAIPIAGAQEVLQEYGLCITQSSAPATPGWQTLSLEEYRQKTGYSASEMLRLEMEGLVIRLPGNRVSIMLR